MPAPAPRDVGIDRACSWRHPRPQLHVVPEPTMVHIWGGVYVPPDESAELQEVRGAGVGPGVGLQRGGGDGAAPTPAPGGTLPSPLPDTLSTTSPLPSPPHTQIEDTKSMVSHRFAQQLVQAKVRHACAGMGMLVLSSVRGRELGGGGPSSPRLGGPFRAPAAQGPRPSEPPEPAAPRLALSPVARPWARPNPDPHAPFRCRSPSSCT